MAKNRKKIIIAIIVLIIVAFFGLQYCTKQVEKTTSEGGMMKVHYYDENGNEITPDLTMSIVGGIPSVHFISFDILAKNTGTVPLENVRITSSSPTAFTNALSTTSKTLAVSPDFVLLWESSLIDPLPLEAASQPVQFCVSVDANYRTAAGGLSSAAQQSDCMGLTILPDTCSDGTPRGTCSPSKPSYCEKIVKFRTNVATGAQYDLAGNQIALDFDLDKIDLEAYLYSGVSTSIITACSTEIICTSTPLSPCKFNVKTREGFNVVYYSGGTYVCDTQRTRSVNFKSVGTLSTSITPVEPYKSNNQEVYSVEFIPKATICGCPEYYETTGETCIAPSCADGTLINTCVLPAPSSNLRYCDAATRVLIEKCGTCGCTTDYYGNPSTGCSGDTCLYQSYTGGFEIDVA